MNIEICKRVYRERLDGSMYATIERIDFFPYHSAASLNEKLFGMTEIRRSHNPFNSSILRIVVE